MEKEKKEEIVIDGAYSVIGRAAAFAAKQVLIGKTIVICNCNDLIIIGKPSSILLDYQERFTRGGTAQKGPYFSKQPEKFVKRTIRGMLPYKTKRGKQALQQIMCYGGVPEKYKDKEKLSFKKQAANFITVSKLCKLI